MEQLYHELRHLARSQRRRLGAADTMNTTAVVHEAYAKLAGAAARPNGLAFADRAHFYRVASRVMRDVIVDYARAQARQKRGGSRRPVPLDPTLPLAAPDHGLDPAEILTVHTALEQLQRLDPESAQVVELRYFAGLTIDQAAEALALSPATVKRRWVVARAWLYQQIMQEGT